MEWLSRRRLGFVFGLALALASLLAVVSFAPQDPTLTNLRYPKDGIGNWLGYPGALLAGSLVEGCGWAALAVPGAVLYWTLCRAGRPRLWRYALQTGALLALAASWSGQWTSSPALGLASPGLIGWAGAQWARQSLGPAGGGAMLALGLALAVWHQLYAPRPHGVAGLRALGRLFGEAGWREAGARMRGEARLLRTVGLSALGTILLAPLHAAAWVAGGAALALGGALRLGILAPLAHLLGGPHGSAGSAHGGGARTLESRLVTQRPTYGAFAQRESGAAFDSWLAPEAPAAETHRAESWAVPGPEATGHPAAGPAVLGPAGQTGAERLARAAGAARGAPPDAGRAGHASPRDIQRETRPAPGVMPDLPPAGSGPERWEQLLRRYRENLDLDWDARTAQREAERSADERAQGPRRPKQPL